MFCIVKRDPFLYVYRIDVYLYKVLGGSTLVDWT